jgi:hypothetical protein
VAANIGFLFGKVGDGQIIVYEAIPGSLPPPVPLPFVTQEIFVNKGGSDATGDGTQGNPYLTIAHALSTILDATTAKRYDIRVGPGEYAAPFQMKPWVGVTGNANASGFYGLTEITAPADTCNLDPAAFGGAGFSVFWISNVVFANHQTWSEISAGNPQVQGTFFNVDFNGGFSFIGPGTGGVDNFTLDGCIVYGGALVQGVQFLFTIGGTQFLGGTVTIQAAPAATALESTTWLAQNTAVGSAFNPTNVHVLWAAPTPAGFASKLDWCNSAIAGTITLDGAQALSSFTGLRPSNILQTNGAPASTVQALTLSLVFLASVTNALGALQATGQIPKSGMMEMTLEGYGGGGGGGGGSGSPAAGIGFGGGAGGAALWQRQSFTHNLANRLDIAIGAQGTPGAGGAGGANNPGITGTDGGSTTALDFTANTLLASLLGASGGSGGRQFGGFLNGMGGTSSPGLNYALYGGGNTPSFGSFGLPACGGAGGNGSGAGFPQTGQNGTPNLTARDMSPPNALGYFAGGLGGTSGGGLSGGGGGGGAGVRGPGGNGGNGTASGVAGNPGSNAPVANSGAGGGGGAGGINAAGGPGGLGSLGYAKLTIVIQ